MSDENKSSDSINEIVVPQDPKKFGLTFTLSNLETYSKEWCNIGDLLYDCDAFNDAPYTAEEFFDYYQSCLDYVIKHSNTALMNCMWDGYYHNDRACPHFESYLVTALTHSDVPTVALALQGINFWNTFDGNDTVTIKRAKECVAKNLSHGKEVSLFLDEFCSLTKQQDQLNNFCVLEKSDEDDQSDDKENSTAQFVTQEFLDLLRDFLDKSILTKVDLKVVDQQLEDARKEKVLKK